MTLFWSFYWLTLKIFHTFCKCLYCWFEQVKFSWVLSFPETYLARPSFIFLLTFSTYFAENRENAHQVTGFVLNAIVHLGRKLMNSYLCFERKKKKTKNKTTIVMILTEFLSHNLLLKKYLRKLRFWNKKQKCGKISCVII